MRLLRVLACIAASSLVGAPALAQDAGTLNAAKMESEAGARLFKEKVFEAAIPHYEKAYALARQPADLQKVAEAYREMGDLGRAYEAYAKLLSVHASQLGTKGAAAVTQTIADLELRTGLITIRCPISGATVTVGDRVVGTTPLPGPVRLVMGSGRVTITKDGFEPLVTDYTADPSHPVTVEATLAPHVTTGHLSVRETHGAAVRVLIDGRDVGAAPWEGDVPAGTHKIELASPVVKTEPQTVVLRHGSRAQAVFTGNMVAGHVHLEATPASATIRVDGKEVGAGQAEVDLAVGRHEVRVEAEGFGPKTDTITVEAGSTQSDAFTLEPTHEAIVARVKSDDAEAIRGGYGQIAAYGALTTSAQNVSCAGLAGNPTCKNGFPLAGGFSVRGGYSLGWVSFELVGLFLADGHTDNLNYPGTQSTITTPTSASQVTHQESYTYSSLGGMVAAGPRFATPGRSFRFTVGAAGGVAIRTLQFGRLLNDGVVENPSQAFSVTLVSPAITADAGLVLGSTPGANFVIGVMLWADFPPTEQTLPVATQGVAEKTTFTIQVPSYTVEKGAQFYFGPYIGARFGH
jgi:PEGA domain